MVNGPPEAQEITNAAATSFPRFFDLPLELRAMVYEYVLDAPTMVKLPHTILPTLFHVHPLITREIYATVMLEAQIFIWNREGLPPLSSLQAQYKVERYYAADRRRLRLHIYALDAVVTFERVREILRLLKLVWRYQMPGPRVFVVPRSLGRDMGREWEVLRKIRAMVGFAEEARWRGWPMRDVLIRVVDLVREKRKKLEA